MGQLANAMSWQSSKSVVRYLVIHIQLLLQVGFLTSAPAASNDERTEPSITEPLIRNIHPPKFPAHDFPITDFGAVADGKTDSTEAIRKAIEACHKAGGGRVVVPDGE